MHGKRLRDQDKKPNPIISVFSVLFARLFSLQPEFTQSNVNRLLTHGIIWVYLSYVLAFLGKEDIAESLSTVVVTAILGVFISSCGKYLVENLSKHNSWPDKLHTRKSGATDCLGTGNPPPDGSSLSQDASWSASDPEEATSELTGSELEVGDPLSEPGAAGDLPDYQEDGVG